MLRMITLRPKAGPTLCASLRSQNALGHVTRAAFDGFVREKCHGPEPRRRLSASLRRRNTHPITSTCHKSHFIRYEIDGKNAAAQNRVTRAALYENYRKFTGKGPRPRTAAHTLCEPAQSKRISTCHKTSLYMFIPFYTEIYRKNAGPQLEHPDQAQAFTTTVRTPQCGHTVWGKRSTNHGKSCYAQSSHGFSGSPFRIALAVSESVPAS